MVIKMDFGYKNYNKEVKMKKCIKTATCMLSVSFVLAGCADGIPTIYDDSRAYFLPYEEAKNRFLIQGYDGNFGHVGYELDFVMDVGSPVLAARRGLVTHVVDVFNSRCPIEKNCSNNLLHIDHFDGSQSTYLHIKMDGACVSEGQIVEQGDVIALSGNVGISVLPHLHFSVVGNVDRPPAFADIGGDGIPKEGRAYVSANKMGHDFCESSSLSAKL